MASVAASAEEMAELHRLSNDYAPVIPGDLVGPRRSSIAISTEYAEGDPIFVRKTTALANTYHQYRPVKGDGNCGWRALAFGFFEALLNSTDSDAIARETARLKSYNNQLNLVGYEPDLYMDFVQETFDLLDLIAANAGSTEGEEKLVAHFNDDGISSSIITHFRLITSAWMKINAALYESFLTNITIDQYRAAHIDPHLVEIEHLGMQACIDAIMKPAGIAVDVMILDRSEGDEVNTISWEPETPSGNGIIPRLRLLYRPWVSLAEMLISVSTSLYRLTESRGHYDILYKLEDHIMLSTLTHVHLLATEDIEFLPSLAQSAQFTPYSTLQQPFPAWMDFTGLSYAPAPIPSNYYMDPYEPQYTPNPYGAYFPPVLPATPYPQPTPPASSCGDPSFRKSKYQLYPQPPPNIPPCETEAMKQAGESTAHYKNQEFQPIIWSPRSESRRRSP